MNAREQAARERAAKDRKQRVEHALEELKKVQASKETEEEKAKARTSSTDPEARVMKMPDGGFQAGHQRLSSPRRRLEKVGRRSRRDQRRLGPRAGPAHARPD
ncbi:MAG TPA: hypothetical protein VGK67_06790 [Myxococcales bacterium]